MTYHPTHPSREPRALLDSPVPSMERRPHPMDPFPSSPKPREGDRGPTRPDTSPPLKEKLLKRMKKVDPKQAERYRQRTGE